MGDVSPPTVLFSYLQCPLLLPRQCREGAALWGVLQLNDSYDLEKHLNISQVRVPSRKLYRFPPAEPPLLALAL